jgi:aromatic ring-opening dioxygenase catalytic subunit (LigB family)
MPQRMPSVFFGHGNPMNALLRNPFTEQWAAIGAKLPKPKAVLCVSAHWYIQDAAVTISASPRTIHDFGGFPRTFDQGRTEASRLSSKKAHIGADRREAYGTFYGTGAKTQRA